MELTRRVRFIALGLLASALLGTGAYAVLGGSTRPHPEHETPLLGGTRVVVEVLNASGKRGLARTATRTLRAAGFDVVFFGTAADSIPRTLILARRGDSAAAARVARALGAGQARVERDTLLRVDVTVRLGADYRPPPSPRP